MPGDGICIGEIAEWCARCATGANAPAEEQARKLAYERLSRSMHNGDFDGQILYHHPRHGTARLTRDSYVLNGDIRGIAAFCWMPRDLARRWLEAHSYPWPAHFDIGAEEPEQQGLAKTKDFAKTKKIDALADFIERKYPSGIPAGVTDKMIARDFDDDSGIKASETTVRRARHALKGLGPN